MKGLQKRLSFLLALVLIVGLFSGCTSSANPVEQQKPSEASGDGAGEKTAGEIPVGRVTDGKGWYLWDENGVTNMEGRNDESSHAMISSAKVEASQAGLGILQAGGNAVDAAVAVGFALGVVECNYSGLGGGGFMTIRSEQGETVFLDFRERAPQAATPALWPLDSEGKVIGNQKFIGGKSVGIPGELAGLSYAFEKYGSGKVSWAEVLAPAIKLAEEGFYVAPELHDSWTGEYGKMMEYPEYGAIYLNSEGFPYEVGQLFKTPALAESLKLIAAEGKDVFYKGAMTEKMVERINKYGGVATLEDFASYEVKELEPVAGTYRGYTIISSPLPSSGGTHIVECLNILENFDMKEVGQGTAEGLHILSEAFRIAFNDRALYMGDPAYVDVPVKGLTNKDYAKAQAGQIQMDKVTVFEEVNPWTYEHKDTTHFSVADERGNMVAVTKTHNYPSGVAMNEYGFFFNNEMDDFSADPQSPNAIAPGKTPLSSMSPTIILKPDGPPFMVAGSPGATRIITAVTQIISNVIDHGMTVQEAINAPRIHNLAVGPLYYEERIGEDVIKQLQDIGYKDFNKNLAYDKYFGNANCVLYGEDGRLHGGADPRRDSKALGF